MKKIILSVWIFICMSMTIHAEVVLDTGLPTKDARATTVAGNHHAVAIPMELSKSMRIESISTHMHLNTPGYLRLMILEAKKSPDRRLRDSGVYGIPGRVIFKRNFNITRNDNNSSGRFMLKLESINKILEPGRYWISFDANQLSKFLGWISTGKPSGTFRPTDVRADGQRNSFGVMEWETTLAGEEIHQLYRPVLKVEGSDTNSLDRVLDDATRDLIVKSGQIKEISARTHRYDNIIVEKGGVLEIRPRSSRWTILDVKGDVRIDGKITGRDFLRNDQPVIATAPDGKEFNHQFSQQAIGGAGGQGGMSSQLGAGTRSGGQGAYGTSEYGGGAGSGGGMHIQGNSSRLGSAGNTANSWRGAPPANDGGYTNKGGDGAKSGRYSNGGLLMIFARGAIGGDGVIDLRGSNGNDDSNGGRGINSVRGNLGAGGGGAGAPGGDGGALYLIADNLDQNRIQLQLDGGEGGRGGAAGPNATGHAAGQPGGDGEDGETGVVDEYLLSDW